MKRILLLLSFSLLSLSFSAFAQARLQIVTTFTVLEDIVKNIVGDRADVSSLTKIGAEVHNYQPSPKELKVALKADILVYNGLNLERWFERFVRDAKHVPRVLATQGITPIDIDSGPYQGTPNPHAWMSVANAHIYIKNITAAVVKYDPKNAAYYKANAQAYEEKINKLDAKAKEVFSDLRNEEKFLITAESAFSYVARDYGFQYDAIWPVNAEEVGTAKQITRIINLVRKYKIPVIFRGSTMDERPTLTIVKETGTHFGGEIYVDTLSEANGPVPTYYDMLEKSVTTIYQGFSLYKYNTSKDKKK